MPDINIRTLSPGGTPPPRRKKKPPIALFLSLASAVATIVVVVILAAQAPPPVHELVSKPDPPPAEPVASPSATPTATPSPTLPAVADDGRSLWESPTQGNSVSLAWLPPGCQCVLHIRPAELYAAGDAPKVIAALGPDVAPLVAWLQQSLGTTLDHVDALVVGLRAGENFVPQWTIVATPQSGTTFKSGTSDDAVVSRALAGGTVLLTSPATLADIDELAGDLPPLRRELELAVAATDADRQLTLVVAPSFLFGDGRQLFAGAYASLRDPLERLLTSDIKALAISGHWDDDFFTELVIVPTGGTKARELAARFDREIDALPGVLEETVVGLTSSEYGRRLVARLPAMLRLVASYTRVEESRERATFRCYLPRAAGHNLLMASELVLAYTSAGPQTSAPAASPAAQPMTLAERLARPTTLAFERDTLEMAVKMLSDDTGISMQIVGGDLQLEGITKNQSFGLNVQNRPAEEILVTILRSANPDKTASGATDPKQKLVYVVGPSDTILITTRAAAEKRGDPLPAAFVPPQ